MVDTKTRTLDLVADSHIRSVDSDDNSMKVEGYAIVFNEPSRQITENSETFYEFITPDAVSDIDWSQVMLLFNHDYNNLLARADNDTLTITVDDKGVFFSAILPDTTLGRDTYEQVKNGNYKGCSFQFDYYPKDCQRITGQHGELFHKITKVSTISELSIVVVPAYDETTVAVARSLNQVVKQNKDGSEEDSKLDKEEILKQLKALMEVVTGKDETDDTEKPAKDDDKPEQVEDKPDDKPVDSEDKPTPDEPEVPEKEDDDKKKPETRDDEDEEIKEDEDRDAVDDKEKKDEDSKPETDEKDGKGEDEESEDAPEDKDKKKDKGDKEMEVEVNTGSKTNEAKRSFEEFLTTGKRDGVTNGVGLTQGQVIIPETILPAEHEEHQFPRLGNLVRTVQVKSTTGKLPVFQTSTDVLEKHDEFQPAGQKNAPEIKPVPWNLQSYTSSYVFSQELIADSEYNWESELGSRLIELQDNTDDMLIMDALTKGITAKDSEDLIADVKTALNVGLKPIDSQNASIILSQSAYDALDQAVDKMGRPMLQPNPTQATGTLLLGKTVVVVDDRSFPKAKVGDINVIVAPLQKAVIRFKQSQISGQLLDTYDAFYKQLGMFVREDVEQARKDLITVLHGKVTAPAGESGK